MLKRDTPSKIEKEKKRVLTSNVISFEDVTSSSVLFSYFSSTSWSMWLDSCDNDHVNSQLDILVWDPIATVSTKNGITTINKHSNGTTQTSNKDPLDLLNQTITNVFSDIQISDSIAFPFKCGAVGYFSYDLGREFEVLPQWCQQDIAVPDMSVGIYTKAIIYDNHLKTFHLVCLENERTDIERFLKTLLDKHAKLPSQVREENRNETFKLESDWLSNMTQSDYAEKFSKVHDYILAGDCYQINLAQRFSAKYSGDEFQAYQALREANNGPFSAFIRLDNAAILSVSPERFLQVKNRKVQSKPIKGTLPRSLSSELDKKAAEKLRLSNKDRAENLMIVDLLRNDMSKVCETGSVVVPQLFYIESFPAVHHLVSTVEGKLAEEFDATDLLRGAFPGGSITGAPKIRAMEIIEELEPHRRSVYCGSIGYISACGNMDTSITIRTLICEQNNMHVWAGGGLVADSISENEYQETFDKLNKITPLLKDKFYKK